MGNRTCWIVGRKSTILTNGHSYITEPFIVFESEDEALAACDLVERVSSERPMIVEASLWRPGSRTGPSAGGKARAAALPPDRRTAIASEAAKARWKRVGDT